MTRHHLPRMLALALCGLAVLTDTTPATQEEELIRARRLERVSHQVEEALPLYQQVAGNASAPAGHREEAFVAQMRCLLKLGRLNEALVQQSRVPAGLNASVIGAQVTSLMQAYQPANPTAPQDSTSLGPRVEGLMEALKGPQHSVIEGSLVDLGELAEPWVVAVARSSTDPEIVQRALGVVRRRLAVTPPGKHVIEFVARLDPKTDPVLCLATLNALESMNRVPDGIDGFLDRCAASGLPGVVGPLDKLMLLRGDDAGDAWTLERFPTNDMPESAARRAKEVFERGRPELQAALAAMILGERDPLVSGKCAIGLRMTNAPGTWMPFLLAPDLPTRMVAFQVAASDATTVFAGLNEDQRGQATASLLSLARSSVPDPDDRASLFQLRRSRNAAGAVPRSRGWIALDEMVGEGLLTVLPVAPSDLLSLAFLPQSSSSRGGMSLELPVPLGLLLRRLDEAEVVQVLAGALRNKDQRRAMVEDFDLMDLLKDVGDRGEHVESLLCVLVAEDESLDKHSLEAIQYLAGHPSPAVARCLHQAWSLQPNNSALYEPTILQVVLQSEALTDGELLSAMGRMGANRLFSMLRALGDSSRLRKSTALQDDLFEMARSHPVGDLRLAAAIELSEESGRERLLEVMAAQQPMNNDGRRSGAEWADRLSKEFMDRLDNRRTLAEPSLEGEMVGVLRGLSRPALAQFGPRWMEHAAKRAVAPANDLVAFAAEIFVGSIGEDDASRALQTMAQRALRELRKGAWQKEWIDAGLTSPDPSVARTTIQLMTHAQILTHRAQVQALLQSESSSTRVAAVQAVSSCMDAAAGLAIVEMLQDPSNDVRDVAWTRIQEVRRYLEEKERWAELGAQDGALSPLGGLLKQVQDPDPTIRLQAVRALGALNDPAALPHLIELLRADDSALKKAAQEAIDHVIERGKPGDD